MVRKIIITIFLMFGIILSATRVYDIEPFKNCNTWTRREPDNWVGQIFVANCDSFVWVEIFIGAPNDTGIMNILWVDN